MPWLTLSLTTAVMNAAVATVLRKHFSTLPPLEMAGIPLMMGLPLFVLIFMLTPAPPLLDGFWTFFLLCLPVNAAGFYLHMRAVNLSPLSVTMPYLAFTPAFVLLTGNVILGELPNIWGGCGVALIVCGSYVLNIPPAMGRDLAAPLRAFSNEVGARSMLVASILYSFSTVLGKRCIELSSPVYFATLFFAAFACCSVAGLALLRRLPLAAVRKRPGPALLCGGCLLGEVVAHNLAIILAKAAYMIAIKRFSVVIAVIFGKYFLGETNIRARLAGASIMFAGAALIGILGD